MPNVKTKIIYSLRIHVALQRKGFSYVVEMRNPQNPNLNCWVYEESQEFLKALDELMGGLGND